MTPEDELEELAPSEQPPTDDPWVIVTPVAKAPEPEKQDDGASRPKRRRWPPVIAWKALSGILGVRLCGGEPGETWTLSRR